MYEVEVKVRAVHDEVRDALEAVDARELGAVRQEDTYYDAPHRDFARTDEAFRIRRETTADERTARVTYKGPLVEAESKTRREVEVGVSDADGMAEILSALGFEPVATVVKERDRYAVGDYAVTLDDVSGLGEFVEVETEAAEEDIEDARNAAYDLLERLNLDPEAQIRTSYLSFLLDK